MKLITLTQNLYAKVDDEDYEELSKYSWYAAKISGFYYAVRIEAGKTIRMHCQIMNTKGIDHKDSDTLNNQRYNLRLATQQQQCFNRTKLENCSSKFKGVTWHNKNKKWQAQLKFKGKNNHLGYFVSEQEAAIAYNVKATELFGEFAKLNEI